MSGCITPMVGITVALSLIRVLKYLLRPIRHP